MTKIVTDQEARHLAVDPTRSFIVQAPAGSGKTELLTDRILALLSIVERPEDILAITFTRKAAAEMHERVMKKIERVHHDKKQQLSPPQEPHLLGPWLKAEAVLNRDAQKGWGLLQNPNRLRIQTIDSFCQSIVRAAPNLSGAGAGISPTEDSAEIMRKAARRTLAQLDTEDSVKTVVSHLDVDLQAFEDLLVSMLKNRQSWLEIVQNPAASVDKMLNTLERFVAQDLAKLQDALPLDYLERLGGVLLEAAQCFESKRINEGKPENNPLTTWHNWKGKPLTCTFEDIHLWKELVWFLFTNDGSARKTVDARQGIERTSSSKAQVLAFLKEIQGDMALEEAVQKIKTLPEVLFNSDNIQVLISFFHCLWLSEQNLQAVFKEEGVVDFNEIAHRALLALGPEDCPTDILLKLDADLKHILIDEFQDTNYQQKQLLDRITAGWHRDDARTLFLVGDPMQSIYRFRNAEVGLFLSIAQKALANKDKPAHEKQGVIQNVVMDLLLLTENFRSDAGIVEWVNHTFAQVFPAQDNAIEGAIKYSPAHAFNEADNNLAVQYYPFDYSAGSVIPDKEIARELAQEQVLSLVKQALANNPESKSPVAILVRSRNHLEEIADKLTAEGIPVKAVKMVQLGETEEVGDFVQLTRALAHRGDRLAWLSVLRAPFIGLTLKTLTHLFEAYPCETVASVLDKVCREATENPQILNNLIGADEAQRVLFAGQVLLPQPYIQGDMTFASYVEQVWCNLGADRLYNSDAERENIQLALAIIDDIAPYGNLDGALLEERVANLFATPATSERAVEIMTMHASKGLEFTEVILYGLNRRPPPDKGQLLEIESFTMDSETEPQQQEHHLLIGMVKRKVDDKKDEVSEYIHSRNKVRLKNEVERLLYVACTRAKKKLHLVYAIGERAESNAMLASLEPTITPDYVYAFDEAQLQMRIEQAAVRLGIELSSGDTDEDDNSDNDTTEIKWAFDNSHLKRYTLDTIKALHMELTPQRIDLSAHRGGAWAFEERLQAAIGTVVHAWLEQIGIDKLQGWTAQRIQQSERLIARQLSRLGVNAAELSSAVTRVLSLLTGVINDERGRYLLSHPGATQEWHLFSDAGQQRIVDLALNTEEGWLIVDYKSNQRLEGETTETFRQRLRDLYQEQLQEYADYLHSIDGRLAKTAIYAVDGCEWIELN